MQTFANILSDLKRKRAENKTKPPKMKWFYVYVFVFLPITFYDAYNELIFSKFPVSIPMELPHSLLVWFIIFLVILSFIGLLLKRMWGWIINLFTLCLVCILLPFYLSGSGPIYVSGSSPNLEDFVIFYSFMTINVFYFYKRRDLFKENNSKNSLKINE